MSEINIIKYKISILFKKLSIIKKKNFYNFKKKRINEIKLKFQKINIIKNIKEINSLNKEKKKLTKDINLIKKCINKLKDISSLIILIENEYDLEFLNYIKKDINILNKLINKLEFQNFFLNKYDIFNCYIDIQSGSGGIDSQDWARMLLRMYLKWSDKHKFKTNIINKCYGNINGIKSSTIQVIGKYAYGWLRTETGIHRLVRKSPFDSTKKRHTSFCSIFVYPVINKTIQIKIKNNDLRIDLYKSSGAGGQNVNKTESAVRITHLPTKIVTQCQNNRSQHKNKYQAMKQLKSKLYKLKLKKNNNNKKKINNKKNNIGWGNQIRSYILDNSRIKDLRTGIEINNNQYVLDGNIDKFIKASLKLGL